MKILKPTRLHRYIEVSLQPSFLLRPNQEPPSTLIKEIETKWDITWKANIRMLTTTLLFGLMA